MTSSPKFSRYSQHSYAGSTGLFESFSGTAVYAPVSCCSSVRHIRCVPAVYSTFVRDCMNLNIMLDPTPLYPQPYHPLQIRSTMDLKRDVKHHSRTSKPTKYYPIDFGISRKYNPNAGPPTEYPIWGGDKTVPEFQNSDEACNPFPTDIYYLGNLIREDFLQVRCSIIGVSDLSPHSNQKVTNLSFMAPLVADMVQDDPSKRPTIDEVVARFEMLRKTLPWWKLRSRLVRRDEPTLFKIPRAINHAFRTMGYVLILRSAVPSKA